MLVSYPGSHTAPAPPPPPPPPPPPLQDSSSCPPPPLSSSNGAGGGRAALLSSIQTFSKGKLKKSDTIDRSKPIVWPRPLTQSVLNMATWPTHQFCTVVKDLPQDVKKSLTKDPSTIFLFLLLFLLFPPPSCFFKKLLMYCCGWRDSRTGGVKWRPLFALWNMLDNLRHLKVLSFLVTLSLKDRQRIKTGKLNRVSFSSGWSAASQLA